MSDDLDTFFAEAAAEAGGEVTEQPAEASEDVVVEEVADQTEADNHFETETDEAEDAESEAEEAASEEVWNWEDYSDQLVPTQVDGETRMVPLSELRDGFMMRSDYTRKTQAVAEKERAAQWAADIQNALNQDPQGTLQVLAQAYGLATPQEQQQNPLDEMDDDIRPWAERTMRAEQELQQMRQSLQNVEVENIKAQVRAEMDELAQIYPDFDRAQVLTVAAEKRVSLEDAHLIVSARRQAQAANQQDAAAQAAAQAAEKVKQETDAKRQVEKKKAASTVDKSFKAVEDISPDEFDTIDELFTMIANGS